jgi:hypothetical protein
VELSRGYDNAAIIRLISTHEPTKVAIDSPFGWPLEFTRTIAAFTHQAEWPDIDDRRSLLFRTTDLAVREATGTDPLSVSTNLLAICAMRCARLLTLLTREDSLDRTGAGRYVEVYPTAALRQWGIDPRGYKGVKPEKLERRRKLVRELVSETTRWLRLDAGTVEQLDSSDHELDALISAVVGRAVELGLTEPIPADHRVAAAAEGWIHLPIRQALSAFDPLG